MEKKFKFVVSKCCFTCKHYAESYNWIRGEYVCAKELKDHRYTLPINPFYCCESYEQDDEKVKELEAYYESAYEQLKRDSALMERMRHEVQ